MTVEHSRTAHSRSRLPGINGLRKARAVGAYIITAGAWLQRISADTNAGYVQCENAFAERPVALRMILRRCYDASARERSANIASVTAIDIGVSVTGGCPRSSAWAQMATPKSAAITNVLTTFFIFVLLPT